MPPVRPAFTNRSTPLRRGQHKSCIRKIEEDKASQSGREDGELDLRQLHSGGDIMTAGCGTASYLTNKLKNCDVALFIRNTCCCGVTARRCIVQAELGVSSRSTRFRADIWLCGDDVLIPHRKFISASWLSTSCLVLGRCTCPSASPLRLLCCFFRTSLLRFSFSSLSSPPLLLPPCFNLTLSLLFFQAMQLSGCQF